MAAEVAREVIPDEQGAECKVPNCKDVAELAAPVENGTDEAPAQYAETRDFRICTLGNVDSGKSSLCGCLTRNILDDGRGKARSYVLQHQHELKRGQTSSVAMQLMGFRNGSQVLPSSTGNPDVARKSHSKDFYEVASKSTHRVTLVDLCGHEKFLKSTIYGLTAMNPDCALVVVGAERGIQRMTREHIGLCCALRIPFFIVMTKVDMAPENVLRETQMKIKRILKRAGRKAFHVRDAADVEGAVKCMDTSQVAFAPVLEVSSVTGHNMDNLREFVRSLATQHLDAQPQAAQQEEKAGSGDKENLAGDAAASDARVGGETTKPAPASNFIVDEVYNVPGVGIVVGGTVLRGRVDVGQKLHVGPDKLGAFREVVVRSVFRQCVPSQAAATGQHATLGIKQVGRGSLKKAMFRKGMVAVSDADLEDAKRQTVWEFDANVKVLHHSTTIDRGYTPFIHLAGVRQSARILQIRSDKGEEVVARTGSQVSVRFRFLYRPEYLEPGRPLIFREGNAKGCGRITALFDADGNQVSAPVTFACAAFPPSPSAGV